MSETPALIEHSKNDKLAFGCDADFLAILACCINHGLDSLGCRERDLLWPLLRGLEAYSNRQSDQRKTNERSEKGSRGDRLRKAIYRCRLNSMSIANDSLLLCADKLTEAVTFERGIGRV